MDGDCMTFATLSVQGVGLGVKVLTHIQKQLIRLNRYWTGAITYFHKLSINTYLLV
jgi:hypothetical protein